MVNAMYDYTYAKCSKCNKKNNAKVKINLLPTKRYSAFSSFVVPDKWCMPML